MKKLILYHGSKAIITNPIYGYGNKHNDYGLGFYCTENIELGKEWSITNPDINGYVNCYELDLHGLNVLDLNKASSILYWMSLLVNNRTFNVKSEIATLAKQYLLNNYLIDVTKYDVIIGYRADDSYFTFAKSFLNNTLSIDQLSLAMKLGELGTQIVLISQKAFDQLTFIKYEEVDAKDYYPLRVKRNRKATNKYLETIKRKDITNETYILDIIRGKKS